MPGEATRLAFSRAVEAATVTLQQGLELRLIAQHQHLWKRTRADLVVRPVRNRVPIGIELCQNACVRRLKAGANPYWSGDEG